MYARYEMPSIFRSHLAYVFRAPWSLKRIYMKPPSVSTSPSKATSSAFTSAAAHAAEETKKKEESQLARSL